MPVKKISWVGLPLLAALAVYWLWFHGEEDRSQRADAAPDKTMATQASDLDPGESGGAITKGFGRLKAAIGAQDEPAPLVAVTGLVRDAATREPVPDAEVVFKNARGVTSAVSDGNGSFSLQVEAGRYAITAVGEGFVGTIGSVAPVPSMDKPYVEILVTPTATVRGTVRDSAGMPVTGARIGAAYTDENGAMKSIAHVWQMSYDPVQDVTDESGEFTIPITPGKSLLVSAKSVAGVVAEEWVKDPEAGGIYEVHLILDGSASLSGRVTLADGKPAIDATVYAISYGKGRQKLQQRTHTDADGKYAFDSIAPTSKLTVEAQLEGVGQSPPTVLEVAGGASLRADLRFTRPVSLAGRVLDPKGQPLSGAKVFARAYGAEVFIVGKSEGDGSFRFDALATGTYKVGAEDSTFGRVDLTEVPGGSTDLTIRLRASN